MVAQVASCCGGKGKNMRKTSRFISILSLLVLVLVMLPGVGVRAAAPELIQKEKQYVTLNEKEKQPFDKSIVIDGKTYQLQNVSYETVSKNPVKVKEKVTLIKKTKPMKKSESFEAEKKITKDGVTYKLTGVSKKEKKSKKKWKQTVAAYSEFDSLGEAQSASGQKMVTVTDKKTGETVVVPCVKTSTKKTAETWDYSHIDILFSGYDAETFIWKDLKVKKNTKNPLKGYEVALIESVGGNPDKYKVQKVVWQGKSYKKNGTLYRKARAVVRKKIPHYRVNYSGSITHTEEPDYVYSCTYAGVKETDSKDISYVVAAKANYQLEQSKETKKVPVFVITLAVVLVLAAVVGILFILVKKRKIKEGGDSHGKIGKNIVDFCTAVEPYAYVMAVVGCLVLGFCFVIPSEKLHKFASSYGPKILIGVGLIAGCVYIGKAIGKQWSF